MKSDIQKLDKNMQVTKPESEGLKWVDPKEAPFKIAGFAWFDEEKIYRRLPLKPEYSLPPGAGVDSLADCTAGGQILFRSDTKKLAIKVKLRKIANMYHMPATGQCGFDCYIGEPGEKKYVSTVKYDHSQISYEFIFFNLKEAKLRNITLNFPLYEGITELQIGIDKNAKILKPVPFINNKKIIIYGTSITQGGCASRPGMAYTNILSRRFNYEFINLGFSGNGRGEPEVAKIISKIKNPGLFVLDYEANSVSCELFDKTLPDFIKILRKNNKNVPILVISIIKHSESFGVNLERRMKGLEIQKKHIEHFQKAGDKLLFFYNGEKLLGKDFYECTVDGIHPTDLGFYKIAESLTPVFKKLLAKASNLL